MQTRSNASTSIGGTQKLHLPSTVVEESYINQRITDFAWTAIAVSIHTVTYNEILHTATNRCTWPKLLVIQVHLFQINERTYIFASQAYCASSDAVLSEPSKWTMPISVDDLGTALHSL